jgi:hypothetical protein
VIQILCSLTQTPSASQIISSMTLTDNTTSQSLFWNSTSTQSYGPTLLGTFLTKGNDTTYSATLTTVATGTPGTTAVSGSITIIKIS